MHSLARLSVFLYDSGPIPSLFACGFAYCFQARTKHGKLKLEEDKVSFAVFLLALGTHSVLHIDSPAEYETHAQRENDAEPGRWRFSVPTPSIFKLYMQYVRDTCARTHAHAHADSRSNGCVCRRTVAKRILLTGV